MLPQGQRHAHFTLPMQPGSLFLIGFHFASDSNFWVISLMHSVTCGEDSLVDPESWAHVGWPCPDHTTLTQWHAECLSLSASSLEFLLPVLRGQANVGQEISNLLRSFALHSAGNAKDMGSHTGYCRNILYNSTDEAAGWHPQARMHLQIQGATAVKVVVPELYVQVIHLDNIACVPKSPNT